jgi:hypothetical protein
VTKASACSGHFSIEFIKAADVRFSHDAPGLCFQDALRAHSPSFLSFLARSAENPEVFGSWFFPKTETKNLWILAPSGQE